MSEHEISTDLSAIKSLIRSYSAAAALVEQQALQIAGKVVETESRLDVSENEAELNQLYGLSKQERAQLLSILKRLSIVKRLADKNENRLKLLSAREDIDVSKLTPMAKKELKTYAGGNSDEITLESLGLSQGAAHVENYFGHKFTLIGGKLSAQIESNASELKSMSADNLELLLQLHPEFVSTLSGEALMDKLFRTTLLKKLTSFVFEQLKTNSVEDVNAMLGNLLSLKYELPDSYDEYMNGVKNLFKVKIKQHLLRLYPQLSTEIEELQCNERSALLPDDLKPRSESQTQTDTHSDNLDVDIDSFLDSLIGG